MLHLTTEIQTKQHLQILLILQGFNLISENKFGTKYKLSNERNDQIFLYVIFSDIPLPMVNVEFTIKCDVSSSKRILDY